MSDRAGRITLWGVEVFAAVAQERSISAAARRLGASPSSVSQQISNLEEALGVRLLERRARPMALTPEGAVFRRRAQAILNEAAQARIELARMDAEVLQELRLGMIEDLDSSVTPALLSRLAEEMGAARFRLETGASHRLLDLLESRAADLVVAAEMGAAAEWMEVFGLMEEPFVAVVPAGIAAEAAEPANGGPQGQGGEALRARLLEMPMIHYTTSHHMGRQVADLLARQNLALPHRFELDSYHAILAMIADGGGWSILTPLAVSHVQRFSAEVAMLPLPFAPLSRRISLFARRGILGQTPRHVAALMRDLLERRIISAHVEKYPWLRGRLRLLERDEDATSG